MRLQNKILIGVLPVVILSLAVVGLLSWRLSTSSQLEQIRQNTILTSESYADKLNTRILGYRRALHRLSIELGVASDIRGTLRHERDIYPEFHHLVYSSPREGRILTAIPSDVSGKSIALADHEHWRRAAETGRVTLSPIETFIDRPALAISAPVPDRDSAETAGLEGIVTTFIPTEMLFASLEAITVGASGRVLVFDDEGTILNNNELPGGEPRQLADLDETRHLHTIAQTLKDRETGWGTYHQPGVGECFLAFAPVPATDWSLAIGGHREDVTSSTDRMTWLVLVSLILATIVASMIIVMSVRNTLEPIREMTELLERVERGQFDVELETERGGEIGHLSRAFNHMTSELRQHRDELETRVQKRTEEIQRINEELRSEIEERREAERALRESQQRYRAMIEQSVEGIYLVDGNGLEIIDFNPAFLELTGYDPDEARGMHVSEVIVSDDDSYYQRIFQSIVENGGMEPREGEWHTKDGDKIDVRVTASYFETGEREIVFVVGRDIREEKRLRAQLEVTDRLASLGTLAAGLAHEINNPLSYIVTNLYFLQEEFERHNDAIPRQYADEWVDVVDQSLEGADRVQQIVDDLRSFYRSDDNEIGLVDVRDVFESVVGLAESDLPPDAEIIQDFEKVPPIRANDSALGQVFMNILVNAIQALPDDRDTRDDRIIVRTYMEGEEHVGVEISDTGEGIPEEDLNRIFDPFFTTKSVDEGTGLGLSMSLNIVTSFDGDIDVESTVDEGTSFYITFPVASASDLSASSIPFN